MKQYDLEIIINKKQILLNLLNVTKTAYPVLMNLNTKTKASSSIRERLMLKHIMFLPKLTTIIGIYNNIQDQHL